MRWQRGLGVGEYIKETAPWMLFYHFGDAKFEVKDAVLPRETIAVVLDAHAVCMLYFFQVKNQSIQLKAIVWG